MLKFRKTILHKKQPIFIVIKFAKFAETIKRNLCVSEASRPKTLSS